MLLNGKEVDVGERLGSPERDGYVIQLIRLLVTSSVRHPNIAAVDEVVNGSRPISFGNHTTLSFDTWLYSPSPVDVRCRGRGFTCALFTPGIW